MCTEENYPILHVCEWKKYVKHCIQTLLCINNCNQTLPITVGQYCMWAWRSFIPFLHTRGSQTFVSWAPINWSTGKGPFKGLFLYTFAPPVETLKLCKPHLNHIVFSPSHIGSLNSILHSLSIYLWGGFFA